jgi:hypothetical protein
MPPVFLSTPFPPLIGTFEKNQSQEAKAYFVARGRGKFTPPKPGGRSMTEKRFPDFRGATPATCENFYQYKRMIASASVA